MKLSEKVRKLWVVTKELTNFNSLSQITAKIYLTSIELRYLNHQELVSGLMTEMRH